jgi:hypothetical protein
MTAPAATGGGDRGRPPTREEGVPDLVDLRQRVVRTASSCCWSDPVLYFHAVRTGRSPSPRANSLRRSWDRRGGLRLLAPSGTQ